jgi:hypothetical protein
LFCFVPFGPRDETSALLILSNHSITELHQQPLKLQVYSEILV